MSELDQLMRDARDKASDLLVSAAERLAAGTPTHRIQGYYVPAIIDLWEEAEARAVLAAGGDTHAAAAIEAVIARLDALARELSSEPPATAGE